MANRTNNGLERYNHHFQSLFPALASRRPSLIEFVKVAEAESRQQAQELEDIRANCRKIPTYKESTIPEIPKEYQDFKKNSGQIAQVTFLVSMHNYHTFW